MALHGSVSTPNLRPEHDRMSGSGDQIVDDMYRMSSLTRPSGKLCDSLHSVPSGPELALQDHGRGGGTFPICDP